MYHIENGNTQKLSRIFKNVKTGDEIIKKAEEQLLQYKQNSQEENVRLLDYKDVDWDRIGYYCYDSFVRTIQPLRDN